MRYLVIAGLACVLAGCSEKQPELIQAGRAEARLVQSWDSGEGPGRDVAFSTDGRLLATSNASGSIVVRRTSDWRVVHTLRHAGGATALAFGPGQLFTAGYDGIVRSWDLGSGKELGARTGAKGAVWSLDVSGDGRELAASGEDALVRLWPIGDVKAEPRVLRGHERNVWDVRFSPDGRNLASGSFDAQARLWDRLSGRATAVMRGHSEAIVGLDFSPDGNLIATGSDDSTLRLWRPNGTPFRTVGAGNHVYDVAFSGDGQFLATGGRARSAIGTFWHQLSGWGAAASPVKIWRTSDLALVAALPHPDDVMDVAFSPNGRHVATSSEDGQVRLWAVR